MYLVGFRGEPKPCVTHICLVFQVYRGTPIIMGSMCTPGVNRGRLILWAICVVWYVTGVDLYHGPYV